MIFTVLFTSTLNKVSTLSFTVTLFIYIYIFIYIYFFLFICQLTITGKMLFLVIFSPYKVFHMVMNLLFYMFSEYYIVK